MWSCILEFVPARSYFELRLRTYDGRTGSTDKGFTTEELEEGAVSPRKVFAGFYKYTIGNMQAAKGYLTKL